MAPRESASLSNQSHDKNLSAAESAAPIKTECHKRPVTLVINFLMSLFGCKKRVKENGSFGIHKWKVKDVR